MTFKQYIYFYGKSWAAVKTALFLKFLERQSDYTGKHDVSWFDAKLAEFEEGK